VKNAVFWDFTPFGVSEERTALCRSPIRVTLMMEVIRFSEKSVLTRATWRNIPETAFFLVLWILSSNTLAVYKVQGTVINFHTSIPYSMIIGIH
jgi:hypothetical protein